VSQHLQKSAPSDETEPPRAREQPERLPARLSRTHPGSSYIEEVGDAAAIPAGSAAPEPEDAARSAEQGYLDRAYTLLAEMEERACAAAADAAERAPGDWDATVAHRFLSQRVASMSAHAGPLCFGRIDEERGEVWHIGRRHVEDAAGEPVVVDWRAPVSIPFYRATFRDPLGLARRRRFILDERQLADLVDEDFHDPRADSLVAASGLPDPLLAELGRARTGAMRDIVATIAGEQDRIIRAPLDVPVIVQGGPGTGKTAVGLHRAAWLLYEHREHLERHGALVLGPNRVFLSYIAEVLPSLGEVAVAQTTLAGLCPEWRVKSEEAAAVARLKGGIVMAEVIGRAAEDAVRPPGSPAEASTRWGAVSIEASVFAGLAERSLASGGPLAERRARFRRAVGRYVMSRLARGRPELEGDVAEVLGELGKDRAFQTVLNRIWPAQSPVGVVRSLYGKPALLRRAAGGSLSSAEQALLRRSRARSVGDEGWTEADLPLLDEARTFLQGAPRRYGHVVVDEAQDLSPMALRMVARRSIDGRSFTILGDLAQATAPAAPVDWDVTLAALGNPHASRVEELSVGYRVPSEIMHVANHVLRATSPALRPTTSVRSAGREPLWLACDPDALADSVTSVAADLLDQRHSVAVIASAVLHQQIETALAAAGLPLVPYGHASLTGHVALVRPELAKGLEFDAVIVAEPALILAEPGGGGLLYIALTRAVQFLAVLFSGELPDVLAAAATAATTAA
jgi:DNA helicase IV